MKRLNPTQPCNNYSIRIVLARLKTKSDEWKIHLLQHPAIRYCNSDRFILPGKAELRKAIKLRGEISKSQFNSFRYKHCCFSLEAVLV